MISSVVNYYDILEVHQEVSSDEIKRSFRTLIKKYHPDIHGPNKLWAESKTKVIIQAYKTLSDSTTREQYDRLYSHHLQNSRIRRHTKREDIQTEDEDILARVRLILKDLLNGHAQNAVENYERLLKDHADVEFLLHLKHRDYIDCKFLLAEAYEKLGQYEIAIEFYEFIYERGKDTLHRRHLVIEIKERIRNIYCRKLARSAPPEKALGYYEKLLRLKLNKNENAFIYKKMAECYLKLKEYESALVHLKTALSLKPSLQGLNKIKTKLRQHIPNLTI
ncbi:MAG: DnaJ domain-containing protein [Planctomycetes bacterium]|uniref:J domain-containing protein n=1 Tax=Candidatus Wunengus californicus TaxID=3367619 RepID=UPI004028C508|nr:DnaJ domain-containing protein [Planctomycetota bacterium]